MSVCLVLNLFPLVGVFLIRRPGCDAVHHHADQRLASAGISVGPEPTGCMAVPTQRGNMEALHDSGGETPQSIRRIPLSLEQPNAETIRLADPLRCH